MLRPDQAVKSITSTTQEKTKAIARDQQNGVFPTFFLQLTFYPFYQLKI